MKSTLKTSGLILLIFPFFLIYSCKKDKPAPPAITTTAVTEISYTTAVSGGNVTSEGGAPLTARGICWNTSADPTIENNIKAESVTQGSFTSNITQLTPNTRYYVKAYATNSGGTGYGDQVSFTTDQLAVPVLTTTDMTSITQTSAVSGGNITDDKGGLITARGVCWSTAHNPTTSDNKTSDNTGTGTFTSSITGLTGMTTYYIRSYATNSVGTAYGNEIGFKTFAVSDKDGNGYYSVTIGTQTWLSADLKTTKYSDGSAVPQVTEPTTWINLITAGFCWYNNDEATYKETYGALYNWYAVNTGKLCPTGWHVPADNEWKTLSDYLGGTTVTSGKLKESGLTHWASPNTGATNETNFTALPTGFRFYDGSFISLGYYGAWWSSTEYDAPSALFRTISFQGNDFDYQVVDNKIYGFGVRCIKN